MGEKVNTSVLSSMLNISSYKKSFIESSIKTARKYGFQGIDLFWLWPNTASNMTNMGILLDEWRAEVNSESRKSGQTQLILTMALHYLPTFEFGSYPIDSIQRNMDFAHVVAYDYHLPSKENLTHAHAALYDPSSIVNTDYGIREWLAKGFPSNKLLLGLPYHGYAWALANPKENAIGSTSSGKAETQDGSMSYKYIKGYIQSYGATIIFNSPYVVNYCIIGSTWINFDDVEAIRAKIAYVKEKKLLGYNVFQLSNDDNWVLSLADPIRRYNLDWPKCVHIIEGVTQGLLYLQEYSNFTIFHRDLKASNILLDKEMTPKISDFEMAKLFGKDEHEANTNRIVGTYGYVPLEYVKKRYILHEV